MLLNSDDVARFFLTHITDACVTFYDAYYACLRIYDGRRWEWHANVHCKEIKSHKSKILRDVWKCPFYREVRRFWKVFVSRSLTNVLQKIDINTSIYIKYRSRSVPFELDDQSIDWLVSLFFFNAFRRQPTGYLWPVCHHFKTVTWYQETRTDVFLFFIPTRFTSLNSFCFSFFIESPAPLQASYERRRLWLWSAS